MGYSLTDIYTGKVAMLIPSKRLALLFCLPFLALLGAGSSADLTGAASSQEEKPKSALPHTPLLQSDDPRSRGGVRAFTNGRPPSFLLYSPDGRFLVSDGTFGAYIWEARPGKGNQVLHRFSSGDHQLAATALSGDGNTVATLESNGDVRLWDSQTGYERKRVGWKQDAIGRDLKQADWNQETKALAISPDAKALALDRVGGLVLWDVAADTVVRNFQGPDRKLRLTSLLFSPDGTFLAASYDQGTAPGAVYVWEVKSGKTLLEQTAPLRVTGLAFSPDSTILGCSSASYLGVPLWRVRDKKLVMKLPECSQSLAFSPDGKYVVVFSAKKDVTARVWELRTGKVWCQLKDVGSGMGAIACSPDGRWVALGCQSPGLLVWDFSSPPNWRVGGGPKDLTKGDLESCWRDLAGEGGEVVYYAFSALLAVPEQAVPFFQVKLTKPGEASHLERLRLTRAVTLLEVIGTPEAERLLCDLAKRAQEEEVRLDATAAVQRMLGLRRARDKANTPR